MKGGWSSGGRRVGGAIYDGRAAETRMGDVSGRRAVVRLGWVGLDNDMLFGFKVLLWRWRWLMAWELTVLRGIYTLRVKGKEEMCFTKPDGDWYRLRFWNKMWCWQMSADISNTGSTGIAVGSAEG